MGLLDRIRVDGPPASGTPLRVGGRRPTVSAYRDRVAAGEPLLHVLRDFLDVAAAAPPDALSDMVRDTPAPFDPRTDAGFAAVVEHRCIARGLVPPDWVNEPGRFLDRWWFVSDLPGLRATSLAQSPIACKRRGIMWPARSMERV